MDAKSKLANLNITANATSASQMAKAKKDQAASVTEVTEEKTLPQTGEENGQQAGLLGAALVGMGMLLGFGAKKKKEQD
ncbi:hypothetical protein FC36_GL000904 [Ligilactobacillus equi DSM 15833 = JCM 10991]|uniref:Gram-positive cocci surface proteins LPxTG domain-containing protein n=3 Tax=Ligilactobacillus equi TaxID=137357 RepID=A0A0R1TCT2_9LACO|nr:hypothetical protein FC36_GL000904 [Ligilactobacillus equi DSM 15833 = JCM 10991]